LNAKNAEISQKTQKIVLMIKLLAFAGIAQAATKISNL